MFIVMFLYFSLYRFGSDVIQLVGASVLRSNQADLSKQAPCIVHLTFHVRRGLTHRLHSGSICDRDAALVGVKC